jgi:glycosyltransferase involved in cell wall biosynthesis
MTVAELFRCCWTHRYKAANSMPPVLIRPPNQTIRVTCIVKRVRHHTDSGGYDRLASEVSANLIVRKHSARLFSRVMYRIWRRLTPTKDYFRDYQIGDWLNELQALAVGFFTPPDVLHVLYNSQIDLLLKWRRLLRCRLVVTFHAPFDDVGPHRFDKYQNGLDIDAAVVVATSQIPSMERWVAPRKIVYVPHGIDTQRFRPDRGELDPNKMRVVIVGEHMRDWSVIHNVIDAINSRHLNIEFHVVTSERYFPYLTGCDNVALHAGISETDLIRLYCSSDILFIPVTNATANNSVLEALSCGTPVVSTEVGGLPDYVTEETGWLLPVGDIDGHVNLLVSIYGNRELARSRRAAARAQALKFDWHLVAQQMIDVYAATKATTESHP